MRALGLIGLVVVAVLAGCSSPPSTSDPGPPPAGDQDTAAVLSALRAIDPCALLPGEDERRWSSPYQCQTVGSPRLLVVVGKWVDPGRDPGERVELAGALAHRRSFDQDCVVDLPVGADLAVRFTAQADGPGRPLCELATTAAEEGVRLLAEPEHLTAAEPHQDACDLLRRAAGADRLDGLTLRFGEAGGYGLDECQARSENEDGWQAVYAVQLLHGAFGTLSNERPDTVAGRPVMVYDTGDSCEYSWRVGESGAPAPLADRILRTRAPDCATAAELAGTLMPTDTEPSPAVEPRRPLTTPA